MKETAQNPAIDLSLVVPAYNEGGNIRAFYEAAVAAFRDFAGAWQIVFVDDGSGDDTFLRMGELCRLPDAPCRITVVQLSRNFGKEAALFAGLGHARGEAVSFIDADLQQRPETLVEMYRLLRQGDWDCVAACRERRPGDLRGRLSRLFYRILARSSRMDILADASDFRVFTRTVADALLAMPEYHRFSKGLFAWIGFRTLPYAYTPEARHAGSSTWSFRQLVRYAAGGLISFTTLPLRLAVYLGLVVCFWALVYLVMVVADRLISGVDVPGYATIVTLLLFFGGLQLLVLGINGEYLARIYIQGKQRPVYIARRVLDSGSAVPPRAETSPDQGYERND